MAVSKKTQAAPAPVNQVNKWDEELAKFATEASAAETVGGSFLSFKSGVLSVSGNPIPGNKLDIVILDYVHENHYYEDAYDPDNPMAPVCFSFGREPSEMVPHEQSAKKQSDTCASCPMNVFGSKGKGKACGNVRRLAIIPADQLDNVPEAEVAFVKLPVTSGKNFAAHVKNVADILHRPPFAVVTELSVVPDMKSQFKVCFRPKANITDGEQLQALVDRRSGMESSLAVPYNYTAPEEEAPKPAVKSKMAAPKRR